MKDFFGKVLARDVILKKGIREGVVDKGRMDEFHNALLGNTDAESFKQEVDQELGDPSLSIGGVRDGVLQLKNGVTIEREWQHIEEAMTATEKAMDEALWDGQYDLAERYKRELEGLRIAMGLGEKYVTNF